MRKLFLFFTCLLFVFAADVFAITDEEIFRIFQFSFVNPGARAGAMGGAFVGLADDATAAEANPAGLTILTKPEVSVEYRHTKFDSDRLNVFNSLPGLASQSKNTIEDLDQPSFLAFVYPFGRSTVAFSRQEVTRTKGQVDEDYFINLGPPFGITEFNTTGSIDEKIVNYNFSLGAKLSDHFSVGATGRYSRIDFKADVANGIGPVVFSQTNTDDTDNAFAWNAGALYSGSHFSAGVVYKKNPKFEVQGVETDAIQSPVLHPGPFTNVLKVPDTFGLGISVKPNDNITVVSDLVRVEYSDLLEGLLVGRNILTLGLQPGDVPFDIADAWEFHIGSEFVVFAGKVPVALRVGYYRQGPGNLFVDAGIGFDTIFPKGEYQNHFTMGNGFVFGPHFQVDWALDLANLSDSFILSSVVRF
jgi:long-chain fatty acid transport protein